MKHLMAQTSFFLLTILFSFNLSAQTIVTVGYAGPNFLCDYSTVQAAINSGATEVRVLNNQTFQENLIINQQITLKGGYPNCLSATVDQPSGANTQIDASGVAGLSAIRIDSTDNSQIKLHRLTLKNAVDIGPVSSGKGLNISGSNGVIQLFDVIIRNNTAKYGAGIYASVSNTGNLEVILNNSEVYGNYATYQGGGIFCNKNNTKIIIQNDSGIFENQAENGGGIAAINECFVVLSSGEDARQGETYSGVVRNLATNDGGGIYADSEAYIYIQGNRHGLDGVLGNNEKPATIANNTAINHGGGIAAFNGSVFNMYDTLIWGNSAGVNGGGFYLDKDVSLLMEDSYRSPCWNQGMCSILAENSGDVGGAIYQSRNSEATINNSHIFNNKANWGLVVFSREDGTAGTISKFHNNMIYHNGQNAANLTDRYLFRGYEPVTIELIHNTITENDINDNNSILGSALGAAFTVQNSIIHNTGETVYAGLIEDLFASCVLVNESTSLVGGNIRNHPPSFINPANDDFHLALGSEAVDMCTGISGFTHDFDGELRGFDDPIQNIQGPYDAGADESYVSDIIFKNDFE